MLPHSLIRDIIDQEYHLIVCKYEQEMICVWWKPLNGSLTSVSPGPIAIHPGPDPATHPHDGTALLHLQHMEHLEPVQSSPGGEHLEPVQSSPGGEHLDPVQSSQGAGCDWSLWPPRWPVCWISSTPPASTSTRAGAPGSSSWTSASSSASMSRMQRRSDLIGPRHSLGGESYNCSNRWRREQISCSNRWRRDRV